MEQILRPILLMIGILSFIVFAWFGLISWREKEQRALRIAVGLALVTGAFFLLAAFSPSNIQSIVLLILGGALLLAIILFFLPVGKVSMGQDQPQQRFEAH